jgi:stage IV sporulation protein FB
MNVLVECPQSSAGEWRFRLLGTDVRVKFWFWVLVCMLCPVRATLPVLLWVAVCLGSALIHELGHVFACRFFGARASIVLYGWGGRTLLTRTLRGPLPEFVAALAGPLAGLAVVALTLVAARLCGTSIQLDWFLFFPLLTATPASVHDVPSSQSAALGYALLNFLLLVNLFWSFVNLLPVYPLDGHDAARAILETRDTFAGRRHSLMLSAVFAAAAAILGYVAGSYIVAIGFVVLCVSSLQASEGERGRRNSFTRSR